MARVSPEMKSKLVADGRWAEFVRYRDARMAEGVASGEAKSMAIAAICPEFAAEAPGRRRGGFRPKGWTKEAEDAAAVERTVAAAAKVEELEGRKAARDAAKRKEREDGFVDAGVFAGKANASAAEEVLWVARNLDVKVGAEDAPGPLAWSFLKLCRESADFRVKFMLNIASDVVKRRTEDDGRGDEIDGQAEYDILAELGEDRR